MDETLLNLDREYEQKRDALQRQYDTHQINVVVYMDRLFKLIQEYKRAIIVLRHKAKGDV